MSAKIVAVFNQKGGCGKTMTTMQLAGTLALRGYRVLVADVDRQKTSCRWSEQAARLKKPFPATVVDLSRHTSDFLVELEPHMEGRDVVLIDCPPAMDSQVPWNALLAADFAIIPLIPNQIDMWASISAELLVLEARKIRKEHKFPAPLHAAYLFSIISRGSLTDVSQNALRATAKIDVLQTQVHRRNPYLRGPLFGNVVTDTKRPNSASIEMNSLADEVVQILKLKVKKAK